MNEMKKLWGLKEGLRWVMAVVGIYLQELNKAGLRGHDVLTYVEVSEVSVDCNNVFGVRNQARRI